MPNPPAGTPHAVEEARERVTRWELVNELVNAEIRRYFERDVDALISAVRTQAFAEVRRVVDEADLFFTLQNYERRSRSAQAFKVDILAALDQMEAE